VNHRLCALVTLSVTLQGQFWQLFHDELEQQFSGPSIGTYVPFRRTNIGTQLLHRVAELSQAQYFTFHEYHHSDHDKLNRRDALGEGLPVILFPDKCEIHAKGVKYASAQFWGYRNSAR
jgi:hypothetical protein